MIFIISTSKDFIPDNNSFYWGSKYFDGIKNYLSENKNEILSIQSAIIYFNKASDKDKDSILLKVNSVYFTDTYLKINYSINKNLVSRHICNVV